MTHQPPRSRPILLLTILAVIALGLASRKIPSLFPAFLDKYPGDALWALMVYLGWEMILPRLSVGKAAALALATSYLDEFSQALHAPWLDAVRNTTAGHLILGTAFSWIDMVAYTVGIGLGVVAELAVLRASSRAAPPTR